MWIAKASDWDASHTPLSTYFIERLKQKLDPSEIISNRHRTTNGYTLVHEIISVASVTIKRVKNSNRLKSLLEEAKDKLLDTNIINDHIIGKFHPDIADFYRRINTSDLSEREIQTIYKKSKIFAARLDKEYFENIQSEIRTIDFRSKKFVRNATQIDVLIDCIIPYLLYVGYSVTALSDIAFRNIFKVNGVSTATRFLDRFKGYNNDCQLCIIVPKQFLSDFKYIKDEAEKKSLQLSEAALEEVNFLFPATKKLSIDEASFVIYLGNFSFPDPHNFIRTLYDNALRNYVIARDRMSLSLFLNFFDNVYWRFSRDIGPSIHYFNTTNATQDPLNVKNRTNTLTSTLMKLSLDFDLSFDRDADIPNIPAINDSLYYYNLAIRSKSLENSLSLLWTALESLIPYRFKDTDIENVQYFVSKSLSAGVIGRELTSFAMRFVETNTLNGGPLENNGIKCSYLSFTVSTMKAWATWLSVNYAGHTTDPFDPIKDASNLLAFEFSRLNEIYSGVHSRHGTVEYWLNKVKKSEALIKYQLDRIYLHRNQIAHTGKFINEYTNLWSHLEWYIGKLLSYAVTRFFKENSLDINKEKIFMELEADNDYVFALLETNKHKKIKDSHDLFEKVFAHSWQFF